MKINISGPITGKPDLNREAFAPARVAFNKCLFVMSDGADA